MLALDFGERRALAPRDLLDHVEMRHLYERRHELEVRIEIRALGRELGKPINESLVRRRLAARRPFLIAVKFVVKLYDRLLADATGMALGRIWLLPKVHRRVRLRAN